MTDSDDFDKALTDLGANVVQPGSPEAEALLRGMDTSDERLVSLQRTESWGQDSYSVSWVGEWSNGTSSDIDASEVRWYLPHLANLPESFYLFDGEAQYVKYPGGDWLDTEGEPVGLAELADCMVLTTCYKLP